MKEQLLSNIMSTCDFNYYEPITGILWKGEEPHQLFSFEHDIEYQGIKYRVVYISKTVYDPADLEAVDRVEVVYFDYWEL